MNEEEYADALYEELDHLTAEFTQAREMRAKNKVLMEHTLAEQKSLQLQQDQRQKRVSLMSKLATAQQEFEKKTADKLRAMAELAIAMQHYENMAERYGQPIDVEVLNAAAAYNGSCSALDPNLPILTTTVTIGSPLTKDCLSPTKPKRQKSLDISEIHALAFSPERDGPSSGAPPLGSLPAESYQSPVKPPRQKSHIELNVIEALALTPGYNDNNNNNDDADGGEGADDLAPSDILKSMVQATTSPETQKGVARTLSMSSQNTLEKLNSSLASIDFVMEEVKPRVLLEAPTTPVSRRNRRAATDAAAKPKETATVARLGSSLSSLDIKDIVMGGPESESESEVRGKQPESPLKSSLRFGQYSQQDLTTSMTSFASAVSHESRVGEDTRSSRYRRKLSGRRQKRDRLNSSMSSLSMNTPRSDGESRRCRTPSSRSSTSRTSTTSSSRSRGRKAMKEAEKNSIMEELGSSLASIGMLEDDEFEKPEKKEKAPDDAPVPPQRRKSKELTVEDLTAKPVDSPPETGPHGTPPTPKKSHGTPPTPKKSHSTPPIPKKSHSTPPTPNKNKHTNNERGKRESDAARDVAPSSPRKKKSKAKEALHAEHCSVNKTTIDDSEKQNEARPKSNAVERRSSWDDEPGTSTRPPLPKSLNKSGGKSGGLGRRRSKENCVAREKPNDGKIFDKNGAAPQAQQNSLVGLSCKKVDGRKVSREESIPLDDLRQPTNDGLDGSTDSLFLFLEESKDIATDLPKQKQIQNTNAGISPGIGSSSSLLMLFTDDEAEDHTEHTDIESLASHF